MAICELETNQRKVAIEMIMNHEPKNPRVRVSFFDELFGHGTCTCRINKMFEFRDNADGGGDGGGDGDDDSNLNGVDNKVDTDGNWL